MVWIFFYFHCPFEGAVIKSSGFILFNQLDKALIFYIEKIIVLGRQD